MAIWKYKVDIKQFLNDDDDSNFGDIATNIIKELRSVFKPGQSQSLDSIIWDLEAFNNDDDVDDFDVTLTDLYDWADANYVWLGL